MPGFEPLTLVSDELDAELDRRLAARPRSTGGYGVLIAIVSVALFAGGMSVLADGDWTWIALLIGVLFVHELGHLAAMRAFGYADLDGGRFLDIVLFSRVPALRQITLLAGAGLLMYVAVITADWLIGALAVFAFLAARWAAKSSQVGKLVRAQTGDALPRDASSIPRPYREALAQAVAAVWGAEVVSRPRTLVGLMIAGWRQACLRPPPAGATAALLGVSLLMAAIGGLFVYVAVTQT